MIYIDEKELTAYGKSPFNEEQVLQIKNKVFCDQYLLDRLEKPIIINGSLSYVEQNAWIQNKSIRDNILFNKPMDEAKYLQTIRGCQLESDLGMLEAGDSTEIGEKGINLSGGQKARISLARAVYSDSDILLMDDPISALDANVKKKVFK